MHSKTPPLPPARVVSDARAFADACTVLRDSSRFAFDVEFIGEDGYAPQVCLLQIATDEHIWLVDPLAGCDVSAFWDFVVDPRHETVVHAGMEDLSLCFQETQRVPKNIFDIQVAAGFVGLDYPLSLQRLARHALGVRLHKSQTLTDWRRRPLSARQIQYAAEDVGFVLPIHSIQRKRLIELNREHWVQEEFERFSDDSVYRQDEKTALDRVRGVGSLGPREWAIAEELAKERDAIARQFNRPPRAILKDHLLVAVAKHHWTQSQDVQSLRGWTVKGTALERILTAAQRGLERPITTDRESATKEQDTPQEIVLCKLISAIVFEYCMTHELSYQLVTNNKDIRALVLSHTRGDGAVSPRSLQRGWRREAVGDLIDDVLHGRRAIRVHRDAGEFQILFE